MACKIAEDAFDPQPFAWPSVTGERAPSRTLFAEIKQPSPSHPDEAAELRRRIAELERAQQTEVAQARNAALQDGIRQGREQAANEVKASGDRLGQVLRDLATVKRRMRSDAELELVQLSLAIARRILHRELSTDPEAIHGLVHAALEKLQNREISRVRVSPAAADSVRVCLERAGVAPAIQIFPDASLRPGDLIFETTLGELDVSVDTQLQEIQRGFADRLSSK